MGADRILPGAAKDPSKPPVVILASIGFVLRNYMMGPFLDALRESASPVVLSPLCTNPRFREQMAARGAQGATLIVPRTDRGWERLRTWRHACHIAFVDNETWRMKHSGLHHWIGLRERFKNGLILGVLRRTVTPGLLRRMDARETRRALASPEAEELHRMFADLNPSLVFSPAPLHPEEWLPIQVARDMGIKTALAVLSWDNLSSKGRLPLPVDRILVWSDHMARELLAYYPGTPPESVRVTGAPQFDYYFLPEYQESRESFFRRFGGDPARPLIVYAGVTPSLVPEEPRLVEELASSLRRGEVPGNPQLLVRLHPKDDGSRYAGFRQAHPEAVVMVPGEQSRGSLQAWQPDADDIRILAATMRHGDVHINIASTMTLDAALLDRPVINVRYLPGVAADALPWGMQGYEMTHYRPLMDTGGFRMAASHAELLKEISSYLTDPARDRIGRRRMVEMICGAPDGRAGARAAGALAALCGGGTA